MYLVKKKSCKVELQGRSALGHSTHCYPLKCSDPFRYLPANLRNAGSACIRCAVAVLHQQPQAGFAGLFKGDTMSAFRSAEIIASQKVLMSASCMSMPQLVALMWPRHLAWQGHLPT